MTDLSPELSRLQLATQASNLAGAARARLGGYVPLDHPAHPTKWSKSRQHGLAVADDDVTTTTAELLLATSAHRAAIGSGSSSGVIAPDGSVGTTAS